MSEKTKWDFIQGSKAQQRLETRGEKLGRDVRCVLMNKAQQRKQTPIYSGVCAYFPLALKEVARVSYVGNEQHNPGQPLFWDRTKSKDELDALVRHLVDYANGNLLDDDGMLHIAKVAWRALAFLEKELEKE